MARVAGANRPRHVPQRTCVACREGKSKRELVRVVRATDGSVAVDPTGKRSGRGAYLCRKPDCWAAALKRGVLVGALKLDAIPPADAGALAVYASTVSAPDPQPTRPPKIHPTPVAAARAAAARAASQG